MIYRCVMALCCGALLLTVLAAEHPRLVAGPAEFTALRERLDRQPFAAMAQRLKDDALLNDRTTGPANSDEPYDAAAVALRTAFLWQLHQDDRYAQVARTAVERLLAHKAWRNRRYKGLTLYLFAARVALAYDWCFGAPSWDDAFCQRVSEELLAHAEVIRLSGGSEQNTNPASNWQGGRFAAAGLAYLATDAAVPEGALTQCRERVLRYLTSNLGSDADARGWNVEGLGYTFYPFGNFVGPFGIALAKHDPALDLRTACPPLRWALWTGYAVAHRALGGIRPDFADDHPHADGEGCYGMAFWYADDAIIPGLRYVYDRTWGQQGDASFDKSRGGTLYSLLFYPDHVAAVDPLTISAWRDALLSPGGNGFITFRDRYADAGDEVAQLTLRARGARGHWGPDAPGFRLLGGGTAWAVGGGRYGPKHKGMEAYYRSQNLLYPGDPDGPLRVNGNPAQVVGNIQAGRDGGGAITILAPTNNVGTRDHLRRFAATYGGACGARAAYVIADTSSNGAFWQWCTYAGNTIAIDDNRFVITSPTGASLRGTVLHATGGARLVAGTRPRGSRFVDRDDNRFLHARSDDGNVLVVVTVVERGEKHPEVTLTGAFSRAGEATVTVGEWRCQLSADAIRLP